MTIFDVTTATVQNNQTAAMFMNQKKTMGIELSCANFVLLQEICLAGDHVSENDIYTWLELAHFFYILVVHTSAVKLPKQCSVT